MIIPFTQNINDESDPIGKIITQSSVMRKLIGDAKQAADSSATVLITGESGTGKELFGQIIHKYSARYGAKFVNVNCAALSYNLIESELFGHEKGSFTDAFQQRIGRFEFANGGTLLLDEVTEIPTTTQAKLLRALEENEIQRVGSNETIATDVRVVATSNRDIQNQIDQDKFRLDLYHRLNVIQIRIPPLRERVLDIPLLANHFLGKFRSENRVAIQGFSKTAMDFLKKYDWPGNIRELKNCIHRACVLTSKPFIDEHCFKDGMAATVEELKLPEMPPQWLKMPLDETERQIIQSAIAVHGTQKLAASYLGITTRTMSGKLKKYRDNEIQRAA